MQFKVNPAQRVQGAMRADFGGADRAFENASDLGEREFLEATKEKDFAVVVIKSRQGRLQQKVIVVDRGAFAGVRIFVRVVLEFHRIVGGGSGGRAAKLIGGAAPGELIHPGGERTFVAISVAVFEHSLEHHLRYVLGRGAGMAELDEKTEERAVMAFEEFAQRIEFAVTNREHERMIGTAFGPERELPAVIHGGS